MLNCLKMYLCLAIFTVVMDNLVADGDTDAGTDDGKIRFNYEEIGELTQTDFLVQCTETCGKFKVKISSTGHLRLFSNSDEVARFNPENPDDCTNVHPCTCTAELEKDFDPVDKYEQTCNTDAQDYDGYYFTIITGPLPARDVTLTFDGKNIANVMEISNNCPDNCVNGNCIHIIGTNYKKCYCRFGWEGERCDTQSGMVHTVPIGRVAVGCSKVYNFTCSGLCEDTYVQTTGGLEQLFANREEEPQIGQGDDGYVCKNEKSDCFCNVLSPEACKVESKTSSETSSETNERHGFFVEILKLDHSTSSSLKVWDLRHEIQTIKEVKGEDCTKEQCKNTEGVTICSCDYGSEGKKCHQP